MTTTTTTSTPTAGVTAASRTGARRTTRRSQPPLEHRVLMTATLLLLAFGAVMVYSASSPLGAISGGGLGTKEFVMYLIAAAIGLTVMRFTERHGFAFLTPEVVRWGLWGSFALLVAVLVPGIGRSVLGARRWIGTSSLEFQPSEIMKLALILYVARYLADNPRRLTRGLRPALAPVGVAVLPACGLIYLEPDLGTAMIVIFSIGALLVAGGVPMKYLGTVAAVGFVIVLGLIMSSSYEAARLTSFLHPWSSIKTTGFQSVEGMVGVGSGGIFGVGLGQGLIKDFYLPEAQTDFILAVIGDELGVVGIVGLLVLYGMIAFAGLRTARKAATRYAKLVAVGITSLILCQALLNSFVVLGIAPLTGVPLPFVSYAPTSLIVLLASVGVLLNIARPSARELRAVDADRAAVPASAGGSQTRGGERRGETSGADRGGRYGGARGAGAGRRRRAVG
ncbi:FtsW/RodA/SpoVE family cell cycle protein [Conexibacter sp. DBS9H8]|uniref:FtsW/RodA/SpoVE family cell cycle protein n=1 Tax=Conexibacter sp. DBS9H8 TaxID=2937801 RepID=UPI00200F017E|nr:putative peptidoglycan glycosyltransferase FtsW [Conexibacter sp. DBS9H8]